jgi:hypothetical protein
MIYPFEKILNIGIFDNIDMVISNAVCVSPRNSQAQSGSASGFSRTAILDADVPIRNVLDGIGVNKHSSNVEFYFLKKPVTIVI